MTIKTLTLKSFRCYDALTLEPNPQLNIIVGANAQGKTSILEAIHTLGLTKSHKLAKDQDLIQKGKDFAQIQALFDLKEQPLHLSVILSKSGKKAKYNKIEMTKLSDYIGLFNVVMFAPEDLELVKGSPQERRRFIDMEIGQLSRAYMKNLLHYRRLLRERNDVLKGLSQGKFDQTMLDVLTEQLIHYAEKIIQARQLFVDDLNQKLDQIHPTLTKDDPTVRIEYAPSIDKDLTKAYQSKRKLDIIAKATQLGPHRDDLHFFFDKDLVKNFASQGQIRSAVLALKLAVVEMIRERKGKPPIILLDDVFSELDVERQRQVMHAFDHTTQVFITTTHIHHIDLETIPTYQIITIESGKIKGVERHGRKTL